MCKLPHRMATSPSSQQKQVPAEQGINAMEHLLAGKKPSGQPQQTWKRGRTWKLVVCPDMSVLAEGEQGLESREFLLPLSCVELLWKTWEHHFHPCVSMKHGKRCIFIWDVLQMPLQNSWLAGNVLSLAAVRRKGSPVLKSRGFHATCMTDVPEHWS